MTVNADYTRELSTLQLSKYFSGDTGGKSWIAHISALGDQQASSPIAVTLPYGSNRQFRLALSLEKCY